jgi:hypothetical protein
MVHLVREVYLSAIINAIDRRKSAVSQWATLQGEKKIWNFRVAGRDRSAC